VAAYGPVESEDGKRRFGIKVTGESKGLVIAWIDGVTDRNAAEALKGTQLFVSRGCLPETEEDEFLYSDLEGLTAEAVDGTVVGRVRGVANFGAGEVLDIVLGQGGSIMVPFTKAAVPVVDVANRRLVVDPPPFAEDEDGQDGENG
jgi:16S rRNA processing protein RimM